MEGVCDDNACLFNDLYTLHTCFLENTRRLLGIMQNMTLQFDISKPNKQFEYPLNSILNNNKQKFIYIQDC